MRNTLEYNQHDQTESQEQMHSVDELLKKLKQIKHGFTEEYFDVEYGYITESFLLTTHLEGYEHCEQLKNGYFSFIEGLKEQLGIYYPQINEFYFDTDKDDLEALFSIEADFSYESFHEQFTGIWKRVITEGVPIILSNIYNFLEARSGSGTIDKKTVTDTLTYLSNAKSGFINPVKPSRVIETVQKSDPLSSLQKEINDYNSGLTQETIELNEEVEKSGSTLRLLGRLMHANYIYNAQSGGGTPGPQAGKKKSIFVRIGGSMMEFVKNTGNSIHAKTLPPNETISAMIEAEKGAIDSMLNTLKSNPQSNDPLLESKYKETKNSLQRIEKAISRNESPKVIAQLISDYNNLLVKHKISLKNAGLSSNIGIQGGSFINRAYQRFEKVQLESLIKIHAIQDRISRLQQALNKKIAYLGTLAAYNPQKIDQYRQDAKSLNTTTNKEILALQQLGAEHMGNLDTKTLAKQAKKPGFVRNFYRWNSVMKNLGDLSNNRLVGRGRSFFVGWGIIELATNGLGENLRKDDRMKSLSIDLADVSLGFIPVVGGVNDLIVFARGEDRNGREIDLKHRLERLGFGIVGLIPGVGWYVKVTKSTKKIAELSSAVQKINRLAPSIYKGSGIYSMAQLGLVGVLGVHEVVKSSYNYVSGLSLFQPNQEQLEQPVENAITVSDSQTEKFQQGMQSFYNKTNILIEDTTMSIKQALTQYNKLTDAYSSTLSFLEDTDRKEIIEQYRSMLIVQKYYQGSIPENALSNYSNELKVVQYDKIGLTLPSGEKGPTISGLTDNGSIETPKKLFPGFPELKHTSGFGTISKTGINEAYDGMKLGVYNPNIPLSFNEDYIARNEEYLYKLRSERRYFSYNLEHNQSLKSLLFQSMSVEKKGSNLYLVMTFYDVGSLYTAEIPLGLFDFDQTKNPPQLDLSLTKNQWYINKLLEGFYQNN